ncbi:MAG: endonuclease [Elusimicrobia bacterium]|nr:endonuclease [Elusimicrobiota bacterium]
MRGQRLAALVLTCLLGASPLFAQVRVSPVPVQVPAGALGGVGAVGAMAASIHPTLPNTIVSPSLQLPASVLPTPGSPAPLAALGRAAAADASLRATLPSSNAAASLAEPAAGANAAKARGQRQTFGDMVGQLKAEKASKQTGQAKAISEALAWREGAPTAKAVSHLFAQPVVSPQAAARLAELFDGTVGRAEAPAAVQAEPAAQTAAGPSGAALRDALRADVRRSHRGNSYDAAKSYLFTDADSVKVEGQRGVVDAYSGIFVPGQGGDGGRYRERGDQDGDGYTETNGMNVEHLWPQSYFNERLPMRADMHHLMATFQHPNSMRGRLPFGEVPDSKAEYHNAYGAKMGNGLFEPPDSAKGRVARAMLYFFVRYGDQAIMPPGVANHFWNSRIEMFLRWNRQFPPTQFERNRNGVVESFQGNRNPFVDDPSLAERIGVEGFQMDARRGGSFSAQSRAAGSEVAGRSSGSNPYRHNHKNKRRRR